jgi:prepilin-type processing-associated H-X9-DG protein
VITIISILAALLAPALKGARDKSLSIKCVSNLRQLHVAIALYGEDHRTFPHGCDAPNNIDWTYLINTGLGRASAPNWDDPNLRSPVVVCPAALKRGSNLCSGYSGHERLFGNTYNMIPGYDRPRAWPFEERPHEVVMLVDGSQNFIDVWGLGNANQLVNFPASMGTAIDYNPATADDAISDVGTDEDAIMSQMKFRHSGGVNVLFVDGHVALMGKDAFRRRNFSISPP